MERNPGVVAMVGVVKLKLKVKEMFGSLRRKKVRDWLTTMCRRKKKRKDKKRRK